MKRYKRMSMKFDGTYIGTNLKVINNLMVTCHSCGIEGSKLTLQEVEKLLLYGMTSDNNNIEHVLMIQDHYHALDFILQNAKTRKSVNLDFIKTINKKVKKNTGKMLSEGYDIKEYDSASGEFRQVHVSVKNRDFIAPDLVQDKMEILEKNMLQMFDLKEEQAIREFAYLIHFDFISIHPFLDGNWRTGRLLMNYIEAFHGLPLTIILNSKKNEYILSMENFLNTKDSSMYLKCMHEIKELGFVELEEYAKKKQIGVDTITNPIRKGLHFIF